MDPTLFTVTINSKIKLQKQKEPTIKAFGYKQAQRLGPHVTLSKYIILLIR